MRNILGLCACIILSIIPGLTLAGEVVVDCTVTPTAATAEKHIPEHFGLSNNLRRKTGSPLLAEGRPIYLEGTVMDNNCVPIPGVLVELWQPDSNGNYPRDKGIDANFTGSGSVTTDNLGRYQFISVLPYSQTGRKPEVHFRITHPNFKPIIATITLGDENTEGILVATPEPLSYKEPDAATIYKFNFAFSDKDPIRGF